MDTKHIIEPENIGLWVAVTFIMALLTLVMSLANLYRTTEATVMTQVQIIELKQQLQALKQTSKP